MSTPSRAQARWTGQTRWAGLALIIAPVLAIVLKLLVFPGWMMFFIILIAIPLLLGYALQIVVSANGMLRARGAFNQATAGAERGLVAAWITSAGVFGTAFFLIDGGDNGEYGSAFTVLTGSSSTATGEQISTILMILMALAWIGGWIWLVVEWFLLLAQLRRSKRSPEATARREG